MMAEKKVGKHDYDSADGEGRAKKKCQREKEQRSLKAVQIGSAPPPLLLVAGLILKYIPADTITSAPEYEHERRSFQQLECHQLLSNQYWTTIFRIPLL